MLLILQTGLGVFYFLRYIKYFAFKTIENTYTGVFWLKKPFYFG